MTRMLVERNRPWDWRSPAAPRPRPCSDRPSTTTASCTVAEGLVQPWSIAFAARRRRAHHRAARTPAHRARRQAPAHAGRGRAGGGLRGPGRPARSGAASRTSPANRFVYLTYSKAKADGTGSDDRAGARAASRTTALTNVQQLFESVSTGRGHFGGRIAFDGKGHLFLTLGDRQVPPEGNLEAHPAQDLTNHHGKVVRLNDDGNVPADNPFVSRAGAKPEIWSYGHRNVQGIAIDPATGNVWTNEHGPQGGDELNLDRARQELRLAGDRLRRQLHAPARPFTTARTARAWSSRCTSGCRRSASRARCSTPATASRGWKGNLFIGGMAGEQLGRVTIAGDKVLARETLLPGVGRIRDIRQGPDGFIYLATEDDDGKPTPVVRLEPVDRAHLALDAVRRTTMPSARPQLALAGVAAVGVVVAGLAAAAAGLDRAALDAQLGRIFQDGAYDPPAFGPARWLPDGAAYSTVEPVGRRRLRHRALRRRHRRPHACSSPGRALVPAGQKAGARHRRLRLVGRRRAAARLHQHRRRSGGRTPAATTGCSTWRRAGCASSAREAPAVVADVREVLARRHARRLRARQQPLRRAARRRPRHAAHRRRLGHDHQRHLRLGLRGGARRARRLPLEPRRPAHRLLAVRHHGRRPSSRCSTTPTASIRWPRAFRIPKPGTTNSAARIGVVGADGGDDALDADARRSARQLPGAARVARRDRRSPSSS